MSDAHLWALERIRDCTKVPANKRGDLDYLRSVAALARGYALAALAPPGPGGDFGETLEPEA